MKPMVVRRTVLAEIAAAEPYPLPQVTLFTACKGLLPELQLCDLMNELAWLRDHEMVDYIADGMDPDNREARRWFLKAAGKAALRQ